MGEALEPYTLKLVFVSERRARGALPGEPARWVRPWSLSPGAVNGT